MIQFEISTLIDRPIQEVSDFVCDPTNLPRWQTQLREIQPAAPGAADLGAAYRTRAELMGHSVEGSLVVTAYEPPGKVAFQMTAGPLVVEATIGLKPVGDGVKLTFRGVGEPGGVLKLASAMLEKQVRSQMEANLASLKALLEASAS